VHHKAEPKPGAWFLPYLFHPNFTGADAYANFLAQVLPGGPPKAAAASADSDGGITWWPFALAGVTPILGALFLVRRCVKS